LQVAQPGEKNLQRLHGIGACARSLTVHRAVRVGHDAALARSSVLRHDRATAVRMNPSAALPSVAHLIAAALLAAPVLAVRQAQDPAAMQKRFDALPPPRQLAVLAAIEGKLRASDDPAMQRIAALAQQARDPAPLRPRTFHDPKVFAPVAPARSLVPADAPQYAAVRSDFPAVQPLRDFAPTILYDWAEGTPARAARLPTPSQRFANLCAGYHPDADAAIAAALVWLDRDADQRPLAHWCEQLYADRDGHVFTAITLYDAWYSRRTVEVPDVDAIAFARTILHTEAYVSPIPDGARRDRLYRQIHEGFSRHRAYRTLCEAAAAAFVNITPALDPTYLPLVDRMHLLWGLCGYDVARFAQKLTAADRAELLDQLDRRLQEDPDAAAMAEQGKAAMRACADAVRTAAAAGLADG
jgi:hypothetical protein